MLDLSKSPVVPTSEFDCTKKRRGHEDFVMNCELNVPEEVAELFIRYTRWIWEYKCIGAVHAFYYDHTIFHGENGISLVGADPIVASSLHSISAYPDKINDFVDIIVEGNEEDGYCFGQAVRLGNANKGWSKMGPPTGKWLGVDDVPLYSICELHVKKVDGKWRVTEEWVVEGTEVKRQTLSSKDTEEAERGIGILPQDAVSKACEVAAEASVAASKAAEAAAAVIAAINGTYDNSAKEE
jgi:hypothetical protein